MAIQVFPDSPSNATISPRISFSHDLPQSDVVPLDHYTRSTASSSIDFDFCVFRETFHPEYSSSADELFLDGKILPIEIKHAPPPTPHPPPQTPAEPKNEIIGGEEKQKSFWRFKRSSSLNCGSAYGRTLCPLPLLSRSSSTGSNASGKRAAVSSHQRHNFAKGNSSNSWQSKPHQAQSGAYSSKPPLKKSGHFSHGGGIKFNPVLNVPPANLFGLGSIFSGGKDRSKKKH